MRTDASKGTRQFIEQVSGPGEGWVNKDGVFEPIYDDYAAFASLGLDLADLTWRDNLRADVAGLTSAAHRYGDNFVAFIGRVLGRGE